MTELGTSRITATNAGAFDGIMMPTRRGAYGLDADANPLNSSVWVGLNIPSAGVPLAGHMWRLVRSLAMASLHRACRW
jgi:hypothetical protein